MSHLANARVDRILGRSATHASGKSGQILACNAETGLVAYAAGCILVLKDLASKSSGGETYISLPRNTASTIDKAGGTPCQAPHRDSFSILNFEEFAEPSKGKERTKAIVSVALSPDSRWLACGEQGQAPRILIWDMRAEDFHLGPAHIINVHTYGVKHLVFSPNSSYLASVGYLHDGTIHVWDLRSCVRKVATNRVTANVKRVIWLGNKLLTVGTRHVRVWQWKPDPVSRRRRSSTDFRDASAAVLEGRNIVLGSHVHSDFVTAIAMNTHCALVTTADAICFIDVGEKQALHEILRVPYQISAIHTGRHHVLVGDLQGNLRSLAYEACEILEVQAASRDARVSPTLEDCGIMYQHNTAITNIYQINSDTIIMAALDGSLVVYYNESTVFRTLSSSEGVLAIRQTEAGSVVLVAQSSGVLRRLDDRSYECSSAKFSDNSLTTVKFLDEHSLVCGTATGHVAYKSLVHPEYISELPAHDGEVCQIVVNTDKTKILSTGRDRMLQLLQLDFPSSSPLRATLSVLQTFDEHSASITEAMFLEDDCIISASADRTIHIRSKTLGSDGREVYATTKIVNLKSMATALVGIPNSSPQVLVSCLDKSFSLLNADTGVFRELCKTEESYDSMLVNATTGVCCCISSVEKLICLRSSETGVLVSNKGYGHADRVSSLEWSHEREDSVITTTYDGLVVFWWFENTGQDKSQSTPIRKIRAKAEPHKLGLSRTHSTIRRSTSVPRLHGTPVRALSPSKLSGNRQSPSPKRPTSATHTSLLPDKDEYTGANDFAAVIREVTAKMTKLRNNSALLDTGQIEELCQASQWLFPAPI